MADKTNSLTAGPRGPILLQDLQLLDEMAHFDRERIPERVVHAKGAGNINTFIARRPMMFIMRYKKNINLFILYNIFTYL